MALEFLFPMPSKNGWHSLRYTHSFFVQTNAKNGKTTNDFLFNACTLVPTVFRRHKKMEFKFHFYFSFFCGLVKWNSISISIFCFLSTCDIEKWIWISFFVFRFRRTLKRGFEFRFCFSFSHHFEKQIWISFFVFRFRITWKTDFNFIFRICVACYWKTDWSFLHEFEKWINTPVIWNSTPPPPKGMTGVMRGLSLHNHPIFIPQ